MNTISALPDFHPALWQEPISIGKVSCTLCPRYCELGAGQNGFCYVRKNIDGKLYSLAYGKPTGFAVDPIEKKPLNHFLPGSSILSFGTAGCNLGCKFCQNWSMSKAKIDSVLSLNCSPEDVIQMAKGNDTPSIAFTYNDPVIFGEYVIDISRLAREEQINSVMVTAGYIDKHARQDVFKYIDAANVDLKAFSESFYHNLTSAHLQDVLDTLLWLRHDTNIWLEITTLLIPGENDSEDETKAMCDWVLENLGDCIPLHFTAFHPDFKMTNKQLTPTKTILHARELALSAGIKYCYVGNIIDRKGQTTFCPRCDSKLIERNWHGVAGNKMTGDKCPKCGTVIAGKFNKYSSNIIPD